MRPPTTAPAPVPTCGTCAHHHVTYTPAVDGNPNRHRCRTTCNITQARISSLLRACPLYERQITPIAPT